MKITPEQRATLEDYFRSLGLKRIDRQKLFRYIRNGGNPEHPPLIILGEPTPGKSALMLILRRFGVNAFSPYELESVTLTRKINLDDEGNRYIRGILCKLGMEGSHYI